MVMIWWWYGDDIRTAKQNNIKIDKYVIEEYKLSGS
jgi:hypothetical protein